MEDWSSRGYLPHYDPAGAAQFVTWRLADSLPAEVYRRWMEELRMETDATRSRELYRRVESYLDEGHGCCMLREPTRRSIVGDSIRFSHGRRYVLHAYVVMPNHVHVLITPLPGQTLAKIIGTMKGFTSREIHKKFGTSGEIWQADYFDRFMRDERHFQRTARTSS